MDNKPWLNASEAQDIIMTQIPLFHC